MFDKTPRIISILFGIYWYDIRGSGYKESSGRIAFRGRGLIRNVVTFQPSYGHAQESP